MAETYASVVKLVDTHDLGSCVVRRMGSSPFTGTKSESSNQSLCDGKSTINKIAMTFSLRRERFGIE